jgi:hypothetical protein
VNGEGEEVCSGVSSMLVSCCTILRLGDHTDTTQDCQWTRSKPGLLFTQIK